MIALKTWPGYTYDLEEYQLFGPTGRPVNGSRLPSGRIVFDLRVDGKHVKAQAMSIHQEAYKLFAEQESLEEAAPHTFTVTDEQLDTLRAVLFEELDDAFRKWCFSSGRPRSASLHAWKGTLHFGHDRADDLIDFLYKDLPKVAARLPAVLVNWKLYVPYLCKSYQNRIMKNYESRTGVGYSEQRKGNAMKRAVCEAIQIEEAPEPSYESKVENTLYAQQLLSLLNLSSEEEILLDYVLDDNTRRAYYANTLGVSERTLNRKLIEFNEKLEVFRCSETYKPTFH